VVQADEAEGDDVHAERRGIEQSAVALDDAGFLQPPDTAQARRSGNADTARQFDIGHAPVALEFAQDLPVDGVEVGFERHGRLSCSAKESFVIL